MKANEQGKELFKIFTKFLFICARFKSQMQVKILYANIKLPYVKRIILSLKITFELFFNNFLKPIC
jgi:hypothetical protein